MSAEVVLDAWRALVPPGVKISAGPLLEQPPQLTERERESAGLVDDNRLLELENGRAYAKSALSMLGIKNAELPIGSDRAPIWPAGVVGSLTHTKGHEHFAVATARTELIQAIGIDAEIIATLNPLIWSQFLTKHELAWIQSLPLGARSQEVLTAWCVKEATVKAMRRPIEPTKIEIERKGSPAGAGKSWRVVCADSSRSAEPYFEVRTSYSCGYVLAVAVVRQPPAT